MSIYADDGDSQIDQSQSQSHSLREVIVSDDVVISKPKWGRPRKSGRAFEVDDVVESVAEIANKKKVKVKRLVNFQPRSSQRLNCK